MGLALGAGAFGGGCEAGPGEAAPESRDAAVGAGGSSGAVTADGCGNGVRDGTEQCEGLDGCVAGQRCTDACTCEASAAPPPTSQDLIEQALERGEIDYPTSLLYRVWALFLAPDLPEAFDGAGSGGEDTYLGMELSQVLGTLPPGIEAAIAPYLVRPTDPTSIYSQEPPAGKPSVTSALEEAPPPVNCPKVNGVPNWGYFETAHFVVWSCGSGRCESGLPRATPCSDHSDCDTAVGNLDGICTAATDQARRLVVGTVAEEIYGAFTPELGPPRADDYAEGPEPRGRIDIYMLRPNECRLRSGQCVGIGGSIAAAMAATPCDRQGGGPLTSSGYALINADAVPALAPARDEPSRFRADLDHELFHVYEYGLNVEVMGKVCAPAPVNAANKGKTWLTEASAEWASFGFFPHDDAERRTSLFSSFQLVRDRTSEGLHATHSIRPYEAALYLQFLQQESGGIEPAVRLWTTSQAARTKEDFDKHLDSIKSFATYFRDFTVRDLNMQLPGAPIEPLFAALDTARTAGLAGDVLKPRVRLFPGLNFTRYAWIAPLFAQYEHYVVDENAREVRIDVSGVPNAEHLQLDALVRVGSTWQRRKVEGPLFKFCREDAADDISEFYLVLSNDDRNRDGRINGEYKIETRAACPGGWSGRVHAVVTLDEYSEESQPAGNSVYSRHERDQQTWTVLTSSPLPPPNPGPGEELVMAWQATLSTDMVTTFNSECFGPPRRGTETGTDTCNGGFSAQTRFNAFPVGAGRYSFTPAEIGHSTDLPTTFTNDDQCEGTYMSGQGTRALQENFLPFLSVQELALLTPLPDQPDHFVGSVTWMHEEQERPGGALVIDMTVSWDLQRTLDR